MAARSDPFGRTVAFGLVVILLSCAAGISAGYLLWGSGDRLAAPPTHTPCPSGGCTSHIYVPSTSTPALPDQFTALVIFADRRQDPPQLEGAWIYRLRRGSRTLFVMGIPNDLWVHCPGDAEMRLSDAYSSAPGENEDTRDHHVRDCLETVIAESIDRTAVVDQDAFDEILSQLGGTSSIQGATPGAPPSAWWHASGDSLETLRRQAGIQNQLIDRLPSESIDNFVAFATAAVQRTGRTELQPDEAAELVHYLIETRHSGRLNFALMDESHVERFSAPDGLPATRLRTPLSP